MPEPSRSARKSSRSASGYGSGRTSTARARGVSGVAPHRVEPGRADGAGQLHRLRDSSQIAEGQTACLLRWDQTRDLSEVKRTGLIPDLSIRYLLTSFLRRGHAPLKSSMAVTSARGGSHTAERGRSPWIFEEPDG
jgi:hypothetical protein